MTWTTTRSDYDHLVARCFRDDWASVHRPVISRGPEDHTLYIGHNYLEPDGVPILCLNGHEYGRLVPHVQPNKVVVVCKECKAKCDVPLVEENKQTELGRRNLVKIAFGAQKQFQAQWRNTNIKGGAQPDTKKETSDIPKASSSEKKGSASLETLHKTPLPPSKPTPQAANMSPQAATPSLPELEIPPRPALTNVRPPFPSIDIRRKDMAMRSSRSPHVPSPSQNTPPIQRKVTHKLSKEPTSSAPTLIPPPTPMERSNSAPQEPTALEPAVRIKRQRSESNVLRRNKRGKPGRGGRL